MLPATQGGNQVLPSQGVTGYPGTETLSWRKVIGNLICVFQDTSESDQTSQRKTCFCIFCHRWPKLPQRLPLVPMMVEAEPMGGTGAISSPFLSHKILAENGSCNLPKTSLLA